MRGRRYIVPVMENQLVYYRGFADFCEPSGLSAANWGLHVEAFDSLAHNRNPVQHRPSSGPLFFLSFLRFVFF